MQRIQSLKLILIWASLGTATAGAHELRRVSRLPPCVPLQANINEVTLLHEPRACVAYAWNDIHYWANCEIGDRWKLTSYLMPCHDACFAFGGWQQVGYTEQSTGLFNTDSDRVNLHQSWLYAEKTPNTADFEWDWGFRADVVYGTDANDTQAFGNDPGEWDFLNGFDYGIYGWAIPQLYAQIAHGNLNVRAGHSYTIQGYEAVMAPENFFFSHSYTFFNSEPFTATGVHGSYKVDDRLTLHAAWTLGWDSGFEQSNQGNLGWAEVEFTPRDGCLCRYAASMGNLGKRGDDAYTHSIVIETDITQKLTYVFQTDVLQVNSTAENNVGVCQYLFHRLNERVSLGSRIEWWKADGVTGFTFGDQIAPPTGTSSYYGATFGVNFRPHANFVIRPELRYNWAPFANFEQSIFAVDMVVTY